MIQEQKVTFPLVGRTSRIVDLSIIDLSIVWINTMDNQEVLYRPTLSHKCQPLKMPLSLPRLHFTQGRAEVVAIERGILWQDCLMGPWISTTSAG